MQSISTTMGQLYLVELTPPFEKLEIQFMPESLDWTRSAEQPAFAVAGRNNPRYQYTGGEDRLTLQLDFYAEDERRQDVIRKVMWLRSLAMNDGGSGPARNVKLVWGQLFRDEVWLISNVKIKLQQFMPQAGMLPQQAYVDLTVILDPTKNLRIRDVRR